MGTVTAVGWLLVAASILAGVYYCYLGISALKHLPDATQQDRVVGWTLWWFLESSRYDEAGKVLCRRGGVIFTIAWALAVPGYYLALRR
jgi:hypothetical protein